MQIIQKLCMDTVSSDSRLKSVYKDGMETCWSLIFPCESPVYVKHKRNTLGLTQPKYGSNTIRVLDGTISNSQT